MADNLMKKVTTYDCLPSHKAFDRLMIQPFRKEKIGGYSKDLGIRLKTPVDIEAVVP